MNKQPNGTLRLEKGEKSQYLFCIDCGVVIGRVVRPKEVDKSEKAIFLCRICSDKLIT